MLNEFGLNARRFLTVTFVVLGSVLSAPSPSLAQAKKPEAVRIVFVTHGQANDAYWTVVKNGMTAAASALKVKVEYQAPASFDVVKLAQMIEAATATRPDGLVISIPDATALEGPIKAAKAAAIPVIVIDSGGEVVKPWGLDLYVGSASEYDNGVQAGELMGKAGVKDAMCVNHEVGNVSLDSRCQGLADGLKATGGKASVVAVSLDPTESARRVEGYMASHRSTDGMLMLGTTLAEPLLKMLDERGYTKKLKIGSFDLSPEVLDALQSDKMMFGIDNQQYMMGYLPVVLLAGRAMYKTIPVTDILTGPSFVTKADAASIKTLSDQGIR
ncbi:substrate-binding domain-containing protein [Microvirga antarctica]|uniref:rhizopine catabolism ABC transporter substrate-binding protein n=1 Tax=Microvirga antarctica TaxID=2819233 RepID=UPI001B304B96|nr:substrate-binding domain-containing protein [Microvirga antarctica]